ncbi:MULTISPECIES: GNAT family N-acetyltransferase [unclassified Rhizobium]|uniref:GNAT family N-acetyltransferase n=1 Tax=unclassified Rhizobium TaxID=2613769 RepID=UPI001C83BB82|nr:MULTISPECIES: GNAT family N-acetyltransferase [unclassified Rhizobium]MBX5157783.1 GNAT family N-acetyltransferase [Rhizobium sp. NZLR8]MBX5164948.1 GNAT family N-acetyltransferase [Rhizobium sp. NZLR4b]MBX5184890.1 GNAT family N-acetyltransferase [Rhizobium sp. NZLR5]MBX5189743.1 GNAT family N-acetyltransferase [Rhizobium sp. NZLR3b]MBX5209763.1 GNAT family N-acetyltransferase [Rhizobium sp. NZLR11]
MSENEESEPGRRARLPDGVLVRAVRLSDAEEITDLINLPGYRAGTLRPPYQRVEEVRRNMENPTPGALNLVVTLDGRIVGNCGLNRLSGRRQHVASLGMGVHDDFTGHGFGRILLGAMVDAADDWLDVKRLELTVYTDNDAAIGLYEKFGFEREGLLRAFGFRSGEYVDAYTMARLRL